MTGVSTLAQALDQIENIKNQQLQFHTLSTQLATGKKTQVFSGLTTEVLGSQRSRADFNALDSYIGNITNADRRIKLMLTAIEEFQVQITSFHEALLNFPQQSVHQEGDIVRFDDPLTPNTVETTPVGMSTATPDVDFETLQDLANNIFDFMINLLNTRDADRFLLGGAETLTQPLDDNGTLDAAITALLTDWKAGTITTTDLISDLTDRTTSGGNLDAITDTTVGYNAPLSSGNVQDVFVRVDETAEVEYTVLANDPAFRDIIVSLAYFKSATLPPIADEVQIDPNTGLPVIITEGAPGADLDEMKDNFYQVFNVLATSVNRAIDDIDQLRFKLENARARIDSVKQSHINEQNVLQTAISDIEDIDINEVAVQINMLQIQLDASFRVTALTQQLSLVNFI